MLKSVSVHVDVCGKIVNCLGRLVTRAQLVATAQIFPSAMRLIRENVLPTTLQRSWPWSKPNGPIQRGNPKTGTVTLRRSADSRIQHDCFIVDNAGDLISRRDVLLVIPWPRPSREEEERGEGGARSIRVNGSRKHSKRSQCITLVGKQEPCEDPQSSNR
jgi:hypothetical protein